MIEKDVIWKICRWVLFFAALQSFGAWFFWNINPQIFNAITAFLCLLLFVGKNRFKSDCSIWLLIYSIAYILTIVTRFIPNVFGTISIFLYLLIVGYVFLLRREYKISLMRFIRKGMACILAFSIIFWILFLIGVPLPNYYVEFGEIDGDSHYLFQNHFLFLQNVGNYFDILIIPRFQSIFLEPGYLGCLMALLLYNGKYQLKGNYENIIFLVALVLSLSLAGYILALLGLLISKLKYSQKKILTLASVVIGVVIAYNVAINVNGGDNILNNYIVARVQFDEAKGIVGNNRMSQTTSDYFWTYFIKSDDLWLGGLEGSDFSNANAYNEVSAYAYIMRFGLISFLFLVLYFFYPFIRYQKNRFELFGLAVIAFLIFAQTIALTHSFMYVFIFVLSINDINYFSKNTNVLKNNK